MVKGGVIVDLYMFKAFIPASHISIKYVNNLQKFVGKVLKVKLIQLNKSKNKIILSAKEVEKLEIEKMSKKLWDNLSKDDIIEEIVSKITNFGVSVDLGGIEGFVYISEISQKHVSILGEVLNIGDKIKVKILSIDAKADRVSLSIKLEWVLC